MANETTATEVKEAPKSRMPLYVAAALIIVVGGGIAGAAYFAVNSNRVSIDKADVEAPQTVLGPTVPGTLMQVYVAPGDTVAAGTVVAEVGTELIRSTSGGLVINTDNDIGASVAPGTAVVTMIDPTQLRVVAQVDENKGLSSIAVGDSATFTVDAFGSKQFTGVVDEVSPTSHASGVVFNISDQRQTQTFDVKVRFDVAAHPELKNGMSARLTIYTK